MGDCYEIVVPSVVELHFILNRISSPENENNNINNKSNLNPSFDSKPFADPAPSSYPVSPTRAPVTRSHELVLSFLRATMAIRPTAGLSSPFFFFLTAIRKMIECSVSFCCAKHAILAQQSQTSGVTLTKGDD